jgi:hypothetical protein
LIGSGPPSVLKLDTLPEPSEVLLALYATGLGPFGRPKIAHILGTDALEIVVAKGTLVRGFRAIT